MELSKRAEMAGYQFVLVGADETKQITQNVLMVKRTTSQDELAEWYSLASCFVLCSKRETFSLVTVESLCCGTPVVAFVLEPRNNSIEGIQRICRIQRY